MNRSAFDDHLAVALASAAMLLAYADRAHAVLFGATSAGQLITIDTATGAGTLVGNIGFGTIEAIESLADGTLVGIANQNQLITINTTTGAGTLVGTVTGYAWVEGLAYSFTNNVLYASATFGPNADANRLISINPATAQPTAIGTFGASFWDVDGLAVSTAGAIVGSHINTNPALFSVDSGTGVGTHIGTLSQAVVGLDYAPDGTLYGVTIPDIQFGGASKLVTVNPATGAILDIGPIGFNTIQAIAFASVPEPRAWLLVGVVAAGAIVVKWFSARSLDMISRFESPTTTVTTDPALRYVPSPKLKRTL